MNTDIPHALAGQQLAVVDTEGNGQQPPEIIELAVLSVNTAPTPADMQLWRVCPQRPITPIVTRKVHGITDADVAECPPWSALREEIATALAGRTLVAHNASVDYRVLSEHLPEWVPPRVLDTLRLAKHVWTGLASYALPALITHAGIDTTGIGGQHHRADYDTWCAWELLRRLVIDGDLDWSDLVTIAALPGVGEPDGGLW